MIDATGVAVASRTRSTGSPRRHLHGLRRLLAGRAGGLLALQVYQPRDHLVGSMAILRTYLAGGRRSPAATPTRFRPLMTHPTGSSRFDDALAALRTARGQGDDRAGRLMTRRARGAGRAGDRRRRNIGAAIALRLAADGAAVAVNHRADVARAGAEATGAVEPSRPAAAGRECSGPTWATRPRSRRWCMRSRAASVGPDLLVNNAAISVAAQAPWHGLEAEAWADVLTVNVTGAFNCATRLTRTSAATGGAVVASPSVTALLGHTGNLHYVTSKAALIGFTRALARRPARTAYGSTRSLPGGIEPPPRPSTGHPRRWRRRHVLRRSPCTGAAYPTTSPGCWRSCSRRRRRFITGQCGPSTEAGRCTDGPDRRGEHHPGVQHVLPAAEHARRLREQGYWRAAEADGTARSGPTPRPPARLVRSRRCRHEPLPILRAWAMSGGALTAGAAPT